MKIDIIIPCYNSKKTLAKTLCSICLQDIAKDLNIYLVNDGSDYDYSFYVNFFSNFINIKELKSKENLGPGEARNIGLNNSNSKYIVFIDSDDNFSCRDAVKELYNEIDKTNNDVVISNFLYIKNGVKRVKRKDMVWLHGKIYRREYIDNKNIRFNNTRANEDNGFNRLILLLTKKVSFIEKITYIYNENNDSITRTNNKEYTFTGIEGLAYNMNWAIKEALKRGLDKETAALLSINVLISMYYYYLKLYDIYDVSKILEWAKETKEIMDGFNIVDVDYKPLLERKRKEDNINFQEKISFEEFLSKIDNI